MEPRTKVVFTSYVADLLLLDGEELIAVRADLKYPEKNVFVFRNSETFSENMNKAILEQVNSRRD